MEGRRADLDVVLAHPAEGEHGVVGVAGLVVVGVVLLDDGGGVVANGLFEMVGCLGGCHFVCRFYSLKIEQNWNGCVFDGQMSVFMLFT